MIQTPKKSNKSSQIRCQTQIVFSIFSLKKMTLLIKGLLEPLLSNSVLI